MDKIRIKVPATSANIGSGFDCMGIAFQKYNTFEFEKMTLGVKFEGCDNKYANVHNLSYVAYKAVCDKLGVKCNVRITTVDIDVPVSRGLGSSATLIVAGAVGANILNGNRLTREQIFAICNDIEGHPDNIAPALYGGLCASVVIDGTPVTVKYPISEEVYFTAVIPDFEVRTRDARATLPKQINHRDAIFNLSRTAILPHALETANFPLIKIATQDSIHEKYKRRLFRNISDVETIAYECGATSFMISGAGSTCLCISDRPIEKELNEAISRLENNWRAFSLIVDDEGAREA
ncbi:MAG: homoserine kinase [Clostridia bacterium]|nr:homoserine kinase [Clostridia bacterium]